MRILVIVTFCCCIKVYVLTCFNSLYYCKIILFVKKSRQKYWTGLPQMLHRPGRYNQEEHAPRTTIVVYIFHRFKTYSKLPRCLKVFRCTTRYMLSWDLNAKANIVGNIFYKASVSGCTTRVTIHCVFHILQWQFEK